MLPGEVLLMTRKALSCPSFCDSNLRCSDGSMLTILEIWLSKWRLENPHGNLKIMKVMKNK